MITLSHGTATHFGKCDVVDQKNDFVPFMKNVPIAAYGQLSALKHGARVLPQPKHQTFVAQYAELMICHKIHFLRGNSCGAVEECEEV